MWMIYAILSLLFWGIWGFVTKVALTSSEWYHYYIYGSITTFIAVIISSVVYRNDLRIDINQFVMILIAGGLGVLGYIFFVLAVKGGNASIVVPLTALYPSITAALSILILGEPVTLKRFVGIILAVIAVLLLSSE